MTFLKEPITLYASLRSVALSQHKIKAVMLFEIEGVAKDVAAVVAILELANVGVENDEIVDWPSWSVRDGMELDSAVGAAMPEPVMLPSTESPPAVSVDPPPMPVV